MHCYAKLLIRRTGHPSEDACKLQINNLVILIRLREAEAGGSNLLTPTKSSRKPRRSLTDCCGLNSLEYGIQPKDQAHSGVNEGLTLSPPETPHRADLAALCRLPAFHHDQEG